MNMKKIFGAAILMAGSTVSAHADLVLDTFEYTSIDPSGNVVSGAKLTFDDDNGAGATFGGLFVTNPDTFGIDSGPGNTVTDTITSAQGTYVGLSAAQGFTVYDLNASGSPKFLDPELVTGAGTLAITAGNEVSYSATISYSDPSANIPAFPGPNPQDFASAGEYFYFDVIAADNANGDSFTVDVTVFDGNGDSSTAALTVPTGVISNQRLLLSFASFSGVDFEDIVGVVADITALGNALDISLDEVGIVPEPTSIALLGLGLLGLGLRSRKKA